MRDPFPIPAPAALRRLVEPVCERLALTILPLHIHQVLFAFFLYEFIHRHLSPRISPILFPKAYGRLNARSRLSWHVHVVSFTQSCLICCLSFRAIFMDGERKAMTWLERIHGHTPRLGMLVAFGFGYFLWDLYVTGWNVNVFGTGMLAHAVSAVTVFSMGFRPFCMYYSPNFLLYELSSPFLNIHWFLDKLDMTGSLPQLLNGIMLLSTFGGCRLIWGSYSSASVFRDIYRAWRHGVVAPALAANDTALMPPAWRELRSATGLDSDVMMYAAGHRSPGWMALVYLASNVVLNGLNWYWYSKMIATIRKRFDPPFGTRLPNEGSEAMDMDVQMGRSVKPDVKKGVEASGAERRTLDVRQRKMSVKEREEMEQEVMP